MTPAAKRSVCTKAGRNRFVRHGLAAVLIVTATLTSAQAEERNATSIAEFVANKNRWDHLVGRPMRLEGRYTIFTSTELRFLNCEMEFVLTRTFRRTPTSTKNIEVSGQLFRKGGGLEFHVTDLKPRESDTDLLKRRRSLADSTNPEGIFALAAWARQRGKFYDDDELLASADRLNREGLTIAYEHLKSKDVAGLRELAAKATEVGVDEGIGLRYLHEADRLEWEQAQAAEVKDYRRMSDSISTRSAGCRHAVAGRSTSHPRRSIRKIRWSRLQCRRRPHAATAGAGVLSRSRPGRRPACRPTRTGATGI